MMGLFVVLFLSFSVFGSEIKVAVELSPAGSFEIKTNTVKGSLKKNGENYISKRISVPTSKLSTGIELRDKHLKEKLETSYIHMRNIKASGGKGTGEIEVKGIKKEVKFTYKIENSKMNFKMNLNLPDFKIEGIKYMGVGVQDVVVVQGMISFQ